MIPIQSKVGRILIIIFTFILYLIGLVSIFLFHKYNITSIPLNILLDICLLLYSYTFGVCLRRYLVIPYLIRKDENLLNQYFHKLDEYYSIIEKCKLIGKDDYQREILQEKYRKEYKFR